MNLKHVKVLNIASLIDVFLGAFLIGCGIFEFTGIIDTNAATSIEAGGIQLSYLVFVSGLLVFICGMLAFLDRKDMAHINLHILLAAASLAWPVFVSLVLFFTQMTICLRLVPTTLSSLFFIISVMIVKVANESLRKVHKFDPSRSVGTIAGEKRKTGINVSHALQGGGKRKTGINISHALQGGGKRRNGVNVSHMMHGGAKHSSHSFDIRRVLNGHAKSSHKHGKSMLYSGQRRRGFKLHTKYK